jgi:acyl-CoA dehydrogenase
MSGFFLSSPLTLLLLPAAVLALGWFGANRWGWAALGLFTALGLGLSGLWLAGAVLVLALLVTPQVRTPLVSGPLMRLMSRLGFLPKVSKTEKEALEAGTTWADAELFSGKPNFDRLRAEAYPGLTAEEQAFLDGPVEEVCRMTDDWQVWQDRDLPAEVWEYLKKERFFGLIVPREYGGHGFSASANSAVVSKLASRSGTLAITVMVPNSLGPAELLAHYGTQEQKDRYLPRLADGREIPAFALTEPGAGSDAGSITASGEVFRGEDGELYLRLNWRKRYITLAAVSSLLGLAFKLRDPQNLLGKGDELGITCALVPTSTEGVVLGMRHDPMGVPFYNCPTEGHDVVLPLEAIIGGEGGIGRGWLMLMECLAAGRGISLPASATSGVKSAARLAGAYAAIRQQFGLSIGKFEGIHEPLARIGGFAYLSEAARRYTCGALDGGAKPAVITAMMKYNTTELSRKAMNDAMDILGGAAISRGPRNLLAHGYIAQPISITVEGANILTRTLVVFGQGAIRCHPFAWSEVQAAERGDAKAFDAALWGHIGHVMRNAARTVLLDLTGGKLGRSPVAGPMARDYKRLDWASARFAFLADVSMGLLGGDLKRREAVTGRFADIFSWMYLIQATLRRFEAEGQRAEDLPFLRWANDYGFARIQEGFDGLFANLNLPLIGWAFSGPARLWSRLVPLGSEPTDRVGAQVAKALQAPGDQRDRLTAGLFVPSDAEEALGRIEHTLGLVTRAEEVAAKIKAAIKARKLPRQKPLTLLEEAEAAGVITAADRALVLEAEAARRDAVEVDSFSLEQYLETARKPESAFLTKAS